MKRKLVVTNAFGDYKVGQEITDAAEVKEIEAGPNAPNVVPTAWTEEVDGSADAAKAHKTPAK